MMYCKGCKDFTTGKVRMGQRYDKELQRNVDELHIICRVCGCLLDCVPFERDLPLKEVNVKA